MPAQELVDAVNILLEQGNEKQDIKDYLVSQGWQEEAVDEVLGNIKKEPSFWEQLPTYPYFQKWDERTANLPPKVIWMICGVLMLNVILIGFIIYFYMNPYVIGGDNRDREREIIYNQLQTAIKSFYDYRGRYPISLKELVPDFIKFIPLDPKTKKPYDYNARNYGEAYSLCIIYETKSVTDGCVNSVIFDTDKIFPTSTDTGKRLDSFL